MIGATLAVAGAGLLLASVLVVTHAAPYDRFPIWTNPRVRRGRSITFRAAGMFLALIGILQFLSPEIGFWSPAVLIAAIVPGAAATIAHNTRLARTHPLAGAPS